MFHIFKLMFLLVAMRFFVMQRIYFSTKCASSSAFIEWRKWVVKIVYDLTPSLDRQLLFSHHFSNNSSLWFGNRVCYTNTVWSRLAPICTWNSFAHLAAYPVLCLYVKNSFFSFWYFHWNNFDMNLHIETFEKWYP